MCSLKKKKCRFSPQFTQCNSSSRCLRAEPGIFGDAGASDISTSMVLGFSFKYYQQKLEMVFLSGTDLCAEC